MAKTNVQDKSLESWIRDAAWSVIRLLSGKMDAGSGQITGDTLVRGKEEEALSRKVVA